MYHFNGGEVGEMRRHGEGGRRGEQERKVRDANLWVAVSTDHLFSLNDSFWYSSSWWSLLLIVDWEGNLCLTTLQEEKGEGRGREREKKGEKREEEGEEEREKEEEEEEKEEGEGGRKGGGR